MSMFGDSKKGSARKFRRAAGIFAFTVGSALCSSAQAATFYADVNAPDNGDGSQARPFKLLWQLVGALKPGDTGLIAPGTYNDGLFINVSGEPDQPITFKALDLNNKPKIRAAGKMVVNVADNMGWINIQGLDVQGDSNYSAIYLSKRVHHVTIQGNYVHDSGCAGIGGGQTDYIRIYNNTVTRNAMTSPKNCSGISLYQLSNYDTLPGYHNIIAKNIIHGNINKVPHERTGKTSDGNGIIIDDARHTQNGLSSTVPAYTGSTLIENNLIFNNGGRGIHIFQSDNVMVRNNTVYLNNNDPQIAETRPGEVEAMMAGSVSVYNNILYSSNQQYHAGLAAQYTTGGGLVADHNITFGYSPYFFKNSTLQYWGSNNVVADPKFVNPGFLPTTADFNVQAGSPARSLGNPNYAPAKDIKNVKRAIPNPVTAGAYE